MDVSTPPYPPAKSYTVLSVHLITTANHQPITTWQKLRRLDLSIKSSEEGGIAHGMRQDRLSYNTR